MNEETTSSPATQPEQDTSQRQIELYAQDLQNLYWSEKKLRSLLAEEKLVLEYKVKELNALNRLFQANLERERLLWEANTNLVEKLRQVLRDEPPEKALQEVRKLLTDAGE